MERREICFTNLQQCIDDVRQLHAGGYERVGNWDLSKVCGHLTKTMMMSIDGAPFNVPFFIKPIIRWMLFKKVLACKQLRLKGPAPKQLLPEESLPVEDAIAQFEAVAQKLMDEKQELILVHPVFGKVTREELLKIQIWHNAHHLSFLIPKS